MAGRYKAFDVTKAQAALKEFLWAFLAFAAVAFVTFFTGLGEALSGGVLPDWNLVKSLIGGLISGLLAGLGKTLLWYLTTKIEFPPPPA
jgi:hypothetical protein